MIYVVGIGLGGRKSLTADAEGVVMRSGLIVGGKRHLAEFADATAPKVPVAKDLSLVRDAIKARLAERGVRKRDVAVLATGDPLFFGIAGFIIKEFGKRRVKVLPNVSVVQEAFSLIKESWGGARLFSVHGNRETIDGLSEKLIGCDRAAILTDPVNTPNKIASALLKKGLSGFKVYVCSMLGGRGEKVTFGPLSTIAKKSFPDLNVMVLIAKGGPTAAAAKAPRLKRLGIPDAEFSHGGGMITKEEIRVVSLSKLDVGRDSVVWDIGSASGSVAIEAARLADKGRVYAFEKNSKRVGDIRRNVKKFGAANISIVEGEAPECMDKALPVPDAVFVGGGGRRVADILNAVAGRIKKGGRVVVNAVTLDTVNAAAGFFKKTGWPVEVVMINISKARSSGAIGLLSANNPVFIITGISK